MSYPQKVIFGSLAAATLCAALSWAVVHSPDAPAREQEQVAFAAAPSSHVQRNVRQAQPATPQPISEADSAFARVAAAAPPASSRPTDAPDELELRWGEESHDPASSRALRELLATVEKRSADDSAVDEIDCRESLCRVTVDPDPRGAMAMMDLSRALTTEVQVAGISDNSASLVAYVSLDALDEASRLAASARLGTPER